MTTNKIIFIPGLGERAKNYRSFSKYMKVWDIDWNNIKLPKGNYDTVIGFSLGADLACMYTLKHKVKNLILCSSTEGFKTLKDIKADKVTFLVSQKEKWCHQEMKRVAKTLRCPSKIIVIPKGNHRISGQYRKTLLDLVKNI